MSLSLRSFFLNNYITLVWLLLILLTAFSWWLSAAEGTQPMQAAHIATTSMFVVAFFKVRMVGLHFMEMRHAPWSLRALFELWAVATCGVIIALYFLA